MLTGSRWILHADPRTTLPMHDPAGFLHSLRQCSGHVAMFEQLQQVDTEQDGWQFPKEYTWKRISVPLVVMLLAY